VVVETMVALVLARAALEKFGGDSLTETRSNIDGYLRAVSNRVARQEAVLEHAQVAD
jgi:chorismate synthase